MPGGLLIPDTSRPALTLPGGERRQAGALPPGIVEIAGIEPAFERGLDARPFAVGDREPGGVAIAALDDISLAENPLEAEPVSRGRGARRRIQRIALPVIAAIAEFVEDAPHHQIHRLGPGRLLLQRRRIGDAADLDAAGREIDVEITRDPDRLAAAGIDDRIGDEILPPQPGLERGAILVKPAIGSPRQIGPHPAVAILAVGGVEFGGMPAGIERLDPAEPAGYRRP